MYVYMVSLQNNFLSYIHLYTNKHNNFSFFFVHFLFRRSSPFMNFQLFNLYLSLSISLSSFFVYLFFFCCCLYSALFQFVPNIYFPYYNKNVCVCTVHTIFAYSIYLFGTVMIANVMKIHK